MLNVEIHDETNQQAKGKAAQLIQQNQLTEIQNTRDLAYCRKVMHGKTPISHEVLKHLQSL